jgi:hypothetical protein
MSISTSWGLGSRRSIVNGATGDVFEAAAYAGVFSLPALSVVNTSSVEETLIPEPPYGV